ncbi:hypothetical protein NP493_673g01004 [Ridgeia piscesae]|uniref:Uncharacterized protein n=1 Tax=Ridgeia piscesae TaxID=27915 RepID=A0AAD9KRQ1_RIDPI|nr:hypothetical protein NP493_673g01004 [Ridgeia piscesae]
MLCHNPYCYDTISMLSQPLRYDTISMLSQPLRYDTISMLSQPLCYDTISMLSQCLCCLPSKGLLRETHEEEGGRGNTAEERGSREGDKEGVWDDGTRDDNLHACHKDLHYDTISMRSQPLRYDTISMLSQPLRYDTISMLLEKLAKEFYLCVQAKDVAQSLQLDEETVDFIYNYWMLKRRANFNKPLLMPKMEEEDRLSKQQENSMLARMKMFVHLRQDLERQIFEKQVQLVNSSDLHSFATRDKKALVGAHRHTGSVYDQPDGILRMARLAEIAAAKADADNLVADSGAARERHHHGRRHHDRGNDPIVKVATGEVCGSNRTRHFSDCLNKITTPEEIVGSGNVQSPQHISSHGSAQKAKKLRSPLQKAQEAVTSHCPDVTTAAATTRSSRLHKLSRPPHTYRNNNNNGYNGLRHKHRKRRGFGALVGKCDPDRHAGFSGQRRSRNGLVVPSSRRLVVGNSIREKVQSRLQNTTKSDRTTAAAANAELKENEPIVATKDGRKTDKSSGTGVIGCDLFHRNIFSDAIHGNASPFGQIAKQAGFGSGVPAADGGATTPTRTDNAGRGTSEARRLRRKAVSNVEAGHSHMLYDSAVAEVKPSCNNATSKEVTFSPFGKKLLPRTTDSDTDLSEDDVSDIGSEDDSTIIADDTEDNDSARNVFLSLRSLRSKSQHVEAVADDLSVDGSNASSSSRYSTRSRLTDSWSKITGACS